MVTSTTLSQLLRDGPQPAKVLYQRLGVSQPTLSRMVAQMGVSVVRFGKARQTQYALRRKVGSHSQFPLFVVSTTGTLEQWGILHPVMPEAYLVEFLTHTAEDPRMDFHLGLPWYLQDMRLQGFIGRAFARLHAPELSLPVDPNRWSDDQTLLMLSHAGHDSPGSLLIGEEAASNFQTEALFPMKDGQFSPVHDEQRLQKYQEFARLALAGEMVGSSAGGEQPKFNITIIRDGRHTQVMVKFSAPQDNATTRRWHSLLICEHLAFQVLSNMLPCSHSELLCSEAGNQIFLEVERFDRIGGLGRRGVASLKSLDDEFTGLATAWPQIAAALVQAGKLNEAVYQQIQRLYAFGVLIGNSDMHSGNLSFLVEDFPGATPKFTLAPVYDMLPMSLAPRLSGQIPDALPIPRISINPPLAVWQEMLPLACHYWQQVAAHTGVADDVKKMAKMQAEILARTLT